MKENVIGTDYPCLGRNTEKYLHCIYSKREANLIEYIIQKHYLSRNIWQSLESTNSLADWYRRLSQLRYSKGMILTRQTTTCTLIKFIVNLKYYAKNYIFKMDLKNQFIKYNKSKSVCHTQNKITLSSCNMVVIESRKETIKVKWTIILSAGMYCNLPRQMVRKSNL